MNQTRIVLVDDDTVLLEALSETLRLRMEQAAVDTCDSATLALDRIAATDYDAIVVDIKMPGMDGLQLLAEIRKLRPDAPVLLITGHGEHDLAIEALRGGAHDYIQKPIDRDYFVASLSHAIQLHRLSRQVQEEKSFLERHAAELADCVQQRADELRAANQTKAELFGREQASRAALNDALAQLEEANRERDEFVSMVAHELMGPLTAITGYAELLGRTKVSQERQARARTVIISEARRVARLVEDLTDAARVAAGRFDMHQHVVDLVEVVQEEIEVARARYNGQVFHFDSPDALLVMGDPERIAQVVSNLLENAVKYAPTGAIRVRVLSEGSQACMTVSDEGPGIPADRIESIFEPHVRLVAEGSGDAPKGTGLGLHIVRGIVEAHGGGLLVQSTPGHGTTFTVSLPLANAPSTRAPA